MITPPHTADLKKYIGLPYANHGRGPDAYDCFGFCMLIMREVFGKNLPDYGVHYDDSEDRQKVSEVIEKNAPNWMGVNPDHLRPGDILVFRIKGYPWHTGVYLGLNDFIHCFRNTHSCVERLNSITWRSRLAGAFRWMN